MDADKGNSNWISFAFVCAGGLAYALTATLFEVFAGSFGVVARMRNNTALQHGLPVAVGLGLFLYLFLNKKIYTWADESITEVRKVVWPSRKDTMAMATVCCVTVIIVGVAFGLFDFVASQLIKVFVN